MRTASGIRAARIERKWVVERRAADARAVARVERHWCDCSSWMGKHCDCGGVTLGRIFRAFVYFQANNLARVCRMFRLGFVRRAFRLSQQAPMSPPRWDRFPGLPIARQDGRVAIVGDAVSVRFNYTTAGAVPASRVAILREKIRQPPAREDRIAKFFVTVAPTHSSHRPTGSGHRL
jgi:hypothetical protein